jgi:hypothetical protein
MLIGHSLLRRPQVLKMENVRSQANATSAGFALWNLGFRLFFCSFCSASAFAALSVSQYAGLRDQELKYSRGFADAVLSNNSATACDRLVAWVPCHLCSHFC